MKHEVNDDINELEARVARLRCGEYDRAEATRVIEDLTSVSLRLTQAFSDCIMAITEGEDHA